MCPTMDRRGGCMGKGGWVYGKGRVGAWEWEGGCMEKGGWGATKGEVRVEWLDLSVGHCQLRYFYTSK